MFTLRKKFTFEAAHRLPNHDGKCKRLHGHSWVMWVEIKGIALEETGPKQDMLVDYGDVKRIVTPLLETELDHHYLNDTTKLANPTSEMLALYVFNRLVTELPGLAAIEIEETCTCSCRFEKK